MLIIFYPPFPFYCFVVSACNRVRISVLCIRACGCVCIFIYIYIYMSVRVYVTFYALFLQQPLTLLPLLVHPPSRHSAHSSVFARLSQARTHARTHARPHSRTHTYTHIRVHFNEIVQSVPPRRRRPCHSFSFIILIIIIIIIIIIFFVLSALRSVEV